MRLATCQFLSKTLACVYVICVHVIYTHIGIFIYYICMIFVLLCVFVSCVQIPCFHPNLHSLCLHLMYCVPITVVDLFSWIPNIAFLHL